MWWNVANRLRNVVGIRELGSGNRDRVLNQRQVELVNQFVFVQALVGTQRDDTIHQDFRGCGFELDQGSWIKSSSGMARSSPLL